MIDQWQGPANTEFTYTVDLGEGKHTIKMDYVERGGDALGVARLGRRARPAVRHLPRASTGTRRPAVNEIPGHQPGLARDEEAIDHDWGAGLARPGHRRRTGSWPAGRAR